MVTGPMKLQDAMVSVFSQRAIFLTQLIPCFISLKGIKYFDLFEVKAELVAETKAQIPIQRPKTSKNLFSKKCFQNNYLRLMLD